MAEFEAYSFEPIRNFSDSDGENTADGQNELARRGNTSWCNCEHCENWENQQWEGRVGGAGVGATNERETGTEKWGTNGRSQACFCWHG